MIGWWWWTEFVIITNTGERRYILKKGKIREQSKNDWGELEIDLPINCTTFWTMMTHHTQLFLLVGWLEVKSGVCNQQFFFRKCNLTSREATCSSTFNFLKTMSPFWALLWPILETPVSVSYWAITSTIFGLTHIFGMADLHATHLCYYGGGASAAVPFPRPSNDYVFLNTFVVVLPVPGRQ